MPTYQYICKQCKHEFEELQSMKEDPLVTCPSCNTDNLARVVGAGSGLIFKGSGFYLTDYKNAPEKKSSGSGEKKGETEKKGDSKEGTKSADSKESSKAETKDSTKPSEKKETKKDSSSSDNRPTGGGKKE